MIFRERNKTISFARVLASNIWELINCLGSMKFFVLVDIKISKALKRVMHIKLGDRQIWIKFKYVKFPKFS